jgi:broad specificity phosphatase PhoE
LKAASRTVSFALIRHGEKERGLADLGLSDEGRRQTAALAEALAMWRPQLLVASPLVRARETAEELSTTLGLKPHIRADLVEREVKPPPGGGRDGFRAEWARIDAERDYLSYAGESSRMAGARLAGALRDIDASAQFSRVAVVAHGGVIRDFVLNVEEGEQSSKYSVSSLSASDIPLASATLVSLEDAEFSVAAVGLAGEELTTELRKRGEWFPAE